MLRDLFSLFPAYAGVILEQTPAESGDEAFPRIRGGDPGLNMLSNLVANFSPHTRG